MRVLASNSSSIEDAFDVDLVSVSSSSPGDCLDLRDPKIEVGLSLFMSVLGLLFGESGVAGELLFPPNLRSTSKPLGEDVKNEAGRLFLWVGVGVDDSALFVFVFVLVLIGVRLLNEGRLKNPKLVLRFKSTPSGAPVMVERYESRSNGYRLGRAYLVRRMNVRVVYSRKGTVNV